MNMECDNSPVSLECAREGQNFPGADLRNVVVADIEECVQYCRDAQDCKAIVFRAQDKRCYLKNKFGGSVGAVPDTRGAGLVSMNMECDNSPVSLECAREGQNFPGADLRNVVVADIEECVQYCRDAQDCKAIVFRAQDQRCYLKNRFGGSVGPLPGTGLVSMNMECNNDAIDLKCEREGVDFPGADLRNMALPTIEECVKYCRDTELCKAVTYRAQDQRCLLKSKFGGSIGPYPRSGLNSLNLECDNSEVSLKCEREGVDFPGADLRNMVLPNIEDCVKYCRDTQDCKAVTYRARDQKCLLKSKYGGSIGPYPRSDLNSINLECDNSPVSLECEREGVDFPGADLRHVVVADIEECVKYCRDTQDCKAVTYRARDQKCLLKSQYGGSVGPYPRSDLNSLNLECDNSPVSLECERNGQNFPGADLRNIVLSNIEECVKYCRDHERCKAVTFRQSDKRCYLKSKSGGAYGPIPQAGHDSLNMDCNNGKVDLSCKNDDTHFPGSDIRNIVVGDLEECVMFCRDAEDCLSVSMRQTDKRCYLKRKEYGHEWDARAFDGYVSINLNC